MSIKSIYQKYLGQNSREKLSMLRTHGLNYFRYSKKQLFVKSVIDDMKKRNCVFIHIPKTAGISVFNALFGQNSKAHIPYTDFEFVLKKTPSLKVVTFVRNPIERFESAYYYLCKGGRKHSNDLKYQEILTNYRDINDFVINGLSAHLIDIEHFIPQVNWLKNSNGEIKIDFIGKLEQIDSDFEKLCELLSLTNILLPKNNVNEVKMKDGLSPEAREVLLNLYLEDFNYFKYEK
jgi:hypothetical protein